MWRHKCDNCGKYFVSKYRQGKYCDQKCMGQGYTLRKAILGTNIKAAKTAIRIRREYGL